MIKAFVDTEIWSLAKKKPVKEKFESKSDYKRALKIHERCKKFFEKLRIYISLHQIAGIFHVQAFRGHRISLSKASTIVESLIDEYLKESLRESKETGIRVWDFLCFIPLKNYVEVIYTLNKHFVTIGKIQCEGRKSN